MTETDLQEEKHYSTLLTRKTDVMRSSKMSFLSTQFIFHTFEERIMYALLLFKLHVDTHFCSKVVKVEVSRNVKE